MPSQEPSPRAVRPAFTLIELLVVIGVVALLIALLLPALAGARDAARGSAMLAQLRTLGQATHLFANASDDGLMRSTHSYLAHVNNGAEPWWVSFYALLDGAAYDGNDGRWRKYVDRALRSPFDAREAGSATGPFASPYDGSYAVNVYFELGRDETPDGRTWRRLTEAPRASATVLFAEVAEADGAKGAPAGAGAPMGGSADHVMAHFWKLASVPPTGEVASPEGRGTGMAYLDGHASMTPLGESFDMEHGVDDWDPATAR